MYVEALEKAGFNVTVQHSSDGNETIAVTCEEGVAHRGYVSRLAGGGQLLGFIESVERAAKLACDELGVTCATE